MTWSTFFLAACSYTYPRESIVQVILNNVDNGQDSKVGPKVLPLVYVPLDNHLHLSAGGTWACF